MIRKKQLLLILGILLLAALFYAYLETPTQQKAPGSGRRPGAGTLGDFGSFRQSAEQKLLLERLQRNAEASGDVKRDIFQFYVKPVVVKPPPKPVVRPAPVVRPQPAVRPVAQPPPKAVVRIDYLGLLEKENQQVFFLEVDDEVVVTRPGDSFGKLNQYHIKSFDGGNLIVSQGPDRPDLTIKVSESATLIPGRSEIRMSAPAGVPSGTENGWPRPDSAPRLKSFKMRDPSALGR